MRGCIERSRRTRGLLAIERLCDSDWSMLQRELDVGHEPPRRRELVLLSASHILQACDEHAAAAVAEQMPSAAVEMT